MKLSPKERRRIYEEEKARIEAEERRKRERQKAKAVSTVDLEPNVAGLLCYVGGWISGVIFLLLEQKNKFVRFHAIQSIIVFGALRLGRRYSWAAYRLLARSLVLLSAFLVLSSG